MDILNQNKIDRLSQEIGAENVPVLLGIFLGELDTYIGQLNHLQGDELDSYLREICHALKSSAASFGAEALCAHSIDVDSMAKLGTQFVVSEEVAKMVSLLEETQQRYQALVG